MISGMEMDRGAVEEYGEVPEQGDFIDVNGQEYLVTRVSIVNGAKVILKVEPRREPKRYDDPTDYSVDWPKLGELDPGGEDEEGEDPEAWSDPRVEEAYQRRRRREEE